MLIVWRRCRYLHSAWIFLLPLFMILYVNPCIGQTKAQKDSFSLSQIPVDSTRLRTIQNKAFTAGEKLVYSVDYGFIHAGTALLTVEKIDRIHGRNCYYITSWALSSPAFSMFFKVEDKIVSYLDVEGLFSWRSEKHLREG